MAQTFGKYEVVAELYSTPDGSVYSARPAAVARPGAAGSGDAADAPAARGPRELREVRFAVKVFNPTGLDLDELFWESQSFLERARLQQRTADAGNGNWAPVHEMGTSPSGAYYVSDYHPLSAARLITGRVDVGPGVLYAIVRSVVAGLAELKDTAGRPHGNLKASNVLISSRGDVAVSGAVLSDPAPAADAAKVGEGGDLQALGELIYLLVTGRPFPGSAAWPLGPSREWNRLGGGPAKLWRRLCNDLLDPDAEGHPLTLAAVARQLPRLAPRRPRRTRRAVVAVVSALLFIAVGASAMLVVQDVAARKEIYEAKDRWAGPLAEALAGSSTRRRAIESDPDLRVVVQELATAKLEQFDRPTEKGRFTLATVLPALWNLKEFPQTQETLAAVRRAERGLSPIRWRQLARAAELQGRYESRGWGQPARQLAQLVAAARPGSADLAGGIERLLRTLSFVDAQAVPAEAEWKQLQDRTDELNDTRDPVLQKFAALLRGTAAGSVRLEDGGFQNLDGIARAAARAAELADARAKLRTSGEYDEARFAEAAAGRFKPADLTEADVRSWLDLFAAHAVQRPQIDLAAGALRKLVEGTSQEVLDTRPDPEDKTQFARQQAGLNARIARFAKWPFIERDLKDGTFETERRRIEADVLALRAFARREDVNEWLKTLNSLNSPSARINAAWESWRALMNDNAPKRAKTPEGFVGLKKQTQDVRDALGKIEEAFVLPRGLGAPFAAAAAAKREQAFDALLQTNLAMNLASDPAALKSASAAYTQWAADLAELARDFPIQQELLGPDARPDAKWATPAKASFWKDPLVQRLVEPDVERLANLRGLAARPPAELAQIAGKSDRAEVVLQAWRLLGSGAKPAWPTQAGELRREADLRRRLEQLLAGAVKGAAERRPAEEEVLREGPVRWRRFVEAARDPQMLASAAQLRDAFGVSDDQFARLSPAARFNLSLYSVREHIRGDKPGPAADRDLDPVVEQLKKAVTELRDDRAVAGLYGRLGTLGEKEPFFERKPGDVFDPKPMAIDVPLELRRVEPATPGGRPFYLSTTEVSLAQFKAVVEAYGAWGRMQSLVWTPQPGVRADTRRGPRAWEWDGPRMRPSILWLAPEESNNYPAAFADPRFKFNRTVLGPAVGGNPSPEQPMQQVSADAALYFAALCGCRLPTSQEWKVAYEQFGKKVPAEKWNLRDKTWEAQRNHAASAGAGDAVQMPDAGAFLPARTWDDKPFPRVPTGAAATVRPQDDHTLFFRPVDARDAGGEPFRDLVGNVAELVLDGAPGFEQYKDRGTPDGVRQFTAGAKGLGVIGGSALSPPELPLTDPLPIKPDAAFADVGFRLAFTAPSRSLAERLEWVLGDQDYVWPAAPTGARAEASR